jgi:hypothetical protein
LKSLDNEAIYGGGDKGMSGCVCSSSHGEGSCDCRSLAFGHGARPSDEY